MNKSVHIRYKEGKPPEVSENNSHPAIPADYMLAKMYDYFLSETKITDRVVYVLQEEFGEDMPEMLSAEKLRKYQSHIGSPAAYLWTIINDYIRLRYMELEQKLSE